MSLITHKNKQLYKSFIDEGIKNANKRDFTKAETFFLKALNLDNKNYLAYINLSNIYVMQNKINKSVKLLIDFISKNIFNELLVNHAAKILYFNNYTKDLTKFFEIIKLDSKKNFNKKKYLYYIQGLYYEKIEDFNQAKKSYLTSILCNKYYFESYIKLLDLYEKTNEFKNFEKLLKQGLKTLKNEEHTIILLYYKSLLLYRINKFNDSQKLIIENNLYFRLKNNSAFLIKLLDIEAKNNEKLKKYIIAFQKHEEKNKIIINLNENKKFNGNNIYSTIEKYKIFFQKKNIDKINSGLSYQDDKNLIFLVGFPRSGTTLLDSILRSHSEISVLEEKPFLLDLRHEFFKQNNNDLSSLLNINQHVKDKIRDNYFKKIISSSNSNKKIIVDKFPLTIIELGFVKCIFPNSKIILAMRHPCDVVISCLFSSFKINDAMVNFLKLNDTIKFYNKVFDLFDFYSKELNLNYLIIKYEEIINNFNIKTKDMTNFLDLKYEENMKNFFITAQNRLKISTPSYSQVIKPIYTTSIDRWKKYPNNKKINRELSKWIKKFNY